MTAGSLLPDPPARSGQAFAAKVSRVDPFSVTLDNYGTTYEDRATWVAAGQVPGRDDRVLAVIDDKAKVWAFPATAPPDIEADSRVANIRSPRWGPGPMFTHGAIGDGLSHPLSGFFATLAAAQAVYPFAASLDDELDWAAAQKALSASAAVWCPAGTYVTRSTLARESNEPLAFFGAGPGVTRWRQTANAAFAAFAHAATGALPGTTHATVAGMTITAATGATITASAIHLDGAHNYPAGTLSNVVIDREAGSTFEIGIRLTDCAGVDAQSVFISGTSAMTAGWRMDNAVDSPGGASGDHQFTACRVYGAARGAQVANTMHPGIEGLQWTGCVFLTDIGLEVTSTVAYGMPMFSWVGGHMACSTHCAVFENVAQVKFTGGALLYYSGDDEWIKAVSCFNVKVDSSVSFFNIGSGDPDGILFTGAGGGSYFVEGAYFVLQGTGYAVRTSSDETFIARYDDIIAFGGSGALSLGYINPTVIVGRGNWPLPTEDHYQTVSVTGGDTLDLSDRRAPILDVVEPGGATTVTDIVPRRDGDIFKLRFNGPLITIEHNAGIILKGFRPFAPVAGSSITLERTAGLWVEVARTDDREHRVLNTAAGATLSARDRYVFCVGGDQTVTLPAAATHGGFDYPVRNNGTGVVTVTAAGGSVEAGSLAAGASKVWVSDHADWYAL